MEVNLINTCQRFHIDKRDSLEVDNMGIDYQRIGRHLCAARKRKGLTQADVSEILNIAENTYSNMERGKQKLSLTRIIQLCIIYEIKPGSVLDDCTDELIDFPEMQEEENVEKQELYLLIRKSSDKTAHILNVTSQALSSVLEL